MTLPSYHPPLQEYPRGPPYQYVLYPELGFPICTCSETTNNAQILLALPTASIIANFAFASSPAITQDSIGLPRYGSTELITGCL
ncbi:hypothetical protein L211DRAFT_837887 [Terfezia boudieri ATCC MYA-4762]|uniref:Uncharacterized protein n=1 Tax=Terfezia boudieri ATCC MYA-4762 TaxID=1051890 RepID=A0A3N4LRZ5_9PEZI|nr:hypothetical protein L211DRAFT_837887 [Terfezia boudieri ATCC MYA-4762]